MSPFKSVKGRALGKLLEGYQTSTLGQGFGSGDGGGGVSGGITDIATLNTSASWAFLPDEDNYSANGVQDTHYNGSRYKVSGGNGTVQMNSYEYPMFGKADIRGGDNTKDVVFQLYNWGGSPTNFHNSNNDGNMFQMGVYWEASPNTGSLTNTLEATSAVSGGDAAYIVTDGYGQRLWGFYNGGSNNNSLAQGTTNREAQSSVVWQNSDQVTFVVYGNAARNASDNNTVKVFVGESLKHTFNATVTIGRPVYTYLGAGYPNGMHTKWDAALPRFRTASFVGGTINV
jgi:hypothetical protein